MIQYNSRRTHPLISSLFNPHVQKFLLSKHSLTTSQMTQHSSRETPDTLLNRTDYVTNSSYYQKNKNKSRGAKGRSQKTQDFERKGHN